MGDDPIESWVLIRKPGGLPGWRWIPRAEFERMQREARERDQPKPDDDASR